MRVGLLTLQLRLVGVDSLKAKRSIVKGLLAEIERRGPAFAVAEVGELDSHEFAVLRIAHVSNDPRFTDASLCRLRDSFEVGKDYVLEHSELEIL